MSTNRPIVTLTLLNILGALVGLAGSIVTAHYFGTSRGLEVFFAASSLQAVAVSLSQGGQINEILIPLYHRLRRSEGVVSAQTAYAVAINWSLIALCGLSLVMWVLAPQVAAVIVPGFGGDDHAAVASAFRWLLPLLPIQVLNELLQGISNAERWFGRTEMYNFISQALGLICILLLSGPLGTRALVLSLWVSQIALLATYVWMLGGLGYKHRAALRHPGMPLLGIFSKLGMTLIYAGCTQVYSMTLSAGLSFLPQGTYATFTYVTRLYSRVNGILLRPVSTVFFSHFSEALGEGSSALARLVRSAMERSLSIGFVMLSASVASAHGIIAFLWGGRLFAGGQLDLAAHLLILFMLMLLMSGVGQVLRKLLIAADKMWPVYLGLSGVQVICAVAAYYLPRLFGAIGAAAVLFLNSAMIVSACVILLRLKMPGVRSYYPALEFLKWLVAAALVSIAGLTFDRLVQQAFSEPANRLFMGLVAALAGFAAAVLILIAAWLLNVADVRKLASSGWHALNRMLRRGTRSI